MSEKNTRNYNDRISDIHDILDASIFNSSNGQKLAEFLKKKRGGTARPANLFGHVEAVPRINFNFDDLSNGIIPPQESVAEFTSRTNNQMQKALESEVSSSISPSKKSAEPEEKTVEAPKIVDGLLSRLVLLNQFKKANAYKSNLISSLAASTPKIDNEQPFPNFNASISPIKSSTLMKNRVIPHIPRSSPQRSLRTSPRTFVPPPVLKSPCEVNAVGFLQDVFFNLRKERVSPECISPTRKSSRSSHTLVSRPNVSKSPSQLKAVGSVSKTKIREKHSPMCQPNLVVTPKNLAQQMQTNASSSSSTIISEDEMQIIPNISPVDEVQARSAYEDGLVSEKSSRKEATLNQRNGVASEYFSPAKQNRTTRAEKAMSLSPQRISYMNNQNGNQVDIPETQEENHVGKSSQTLVTNETMNTTNITRTLVGTNTPIAKNNSMESTKSYESFYSTQDFENEVYDKVSQKMIETVQSFAKEQRESNFTTQISESTCLEDECRASTFVVPNVKRPGRKKIKIEPTAKSYFDGVEKLKKKKIKKKRDGERRKLFCKEIDRDSHESRSPVKTRPSILNDDTHKTQPKEAEKKQNKCKEQDGGSKERNLPPKLDQNLELNKFPTLLTSNTNTKRQKQKEVHSMQVSEKEESDSVPQKSEPAPRYLRSRSKKIIEKAQQPEKTKTSSKPPVKRSSNRLESKKQSISSSDSDEGLQTESKKLTESVKCVARQESGTDLADRNSKNSQSIVIKKGKLRKHGSMKHGNERDESTSRIEDELTSGEEDAVCEKDVSRRKSRSNVVFTSKTDSKQIENGDSRTLSARATPEKISRQSRREESDDDDSESDTKIRVRKSFVGKTYSRREKRLSNANKKQGAAPMKSTMIRSSDDSCAEDDQVAMEKHAINKANEVPTPKKSHESRRDKKGRSVVSESLPNKEEADRSKNHRVNYLKPLMATDDSDVSDVDASVKKSCRKENKFQRKSKSRKKERTHRDTDTSDDSGRDENASDAPREAFKKVPTKNSNKSKIEDNEELERKNKKTRSPEIRADELNGGTDAEIELSTEKRASVPNFDTDNDSDESFSKIIEDARNRVRVEKVLQEKKAIEDAEVRRRTVIDSASQINKNTDDTTMASSANESNARKSNKILLEESHKDLKNNGKKLEVRENDRSDTEKEAPRSNTARKSSNQHVTVERKKKNLEKIEKKSKKALTVASKETFDKSNTESVPTKIKSSDHSITSHHLSSFSRKESHELRESVNRGEYIETDSGIIETASLTTNSHEYETRNVRRDEEREVESSLFRETNTHHDSRRKTKSMLSNPATAPAELLAAGGSKGAIPKTTTKLSKKKKKKRDSYFDLDVSHHIPPKKNKNDCSHDFVVPDSCSTTISDQNASALKLLWKEQATNSENANNCPPHRLSTSSIDSLNEPARNTTLKSVKDASNRAMRSIDNMIVSPPTKFSDKTKRTKKKKVDKDIANTKIAAAEQDGIRRGSRTRRLPGALLICHPELTATSKPNYKPLDVKDYIEAELNRKEYKNRIKKKRVQPKEKAQSSTPIAQSSTPIAQSSKSIAQSSNEHERPTKTTNNFEFKVPQIPAKTHKNKKIVSNDFTVDSGTHTDDHEDQATLDTYDSSTNGQDEICTYLRKIVHTDDLTELNKSVQAVEPRMPNLNGPDGVLIQFLKSNSVKFMEYDGISYGFYITTNSENYGFLKFRPNTFKKPTRTKSFHLKFLVLSGSILATIDSLEYKMEEGDFLVIPRERTYSLRNKTGNTLLYLMKLRTNNASLDPSS